MLHSDGVFGRELEVLLLRCCRIGRDLQGRRFGWAQIGLDRHLALVGGLETGDPTRWRRCRQGVRQVSLLVSGSWLAEERGQSDSFEMCLVIQFKIKVKFDQASLEIKQSTLEKVQSLEMLSIYPQRYRIRLKLFFGSSSGCSIVDCCVWEASLVDGSAGLQSGPRLVVLSVTQEPISFHPMHSIWVPSYPTISAGNNQGQTKGDTA